MPADTDFADSLSPVVAAYRRRLAARGLFDEQDDYAVARALGDNNPALLEQDPEFAKLWGELREANAPSLGAEIGRAAKRATIGLGSTAVGGAALLTGSDYLKRKAAAISLQASDPELASTIPTLEDIRSGRDAVRYGLSKVGEAAPSLVEAVGVGLVGAAAGSTFGPGGTLAGGVIGRGVVKKAIQSLVTKELAKETIEQGLKKGVPQIVELVTKNAARLAKVGGGTAAAAVNSYVLNSGEVYAENEDRATSAALGLVAAIPDTVLPALVLRRIFPGATLSAGRAAAKELVGKNAIKVAQAAGVVGFEGATESFQEAVNIVARNLKEGVDPFTVTDDDKIRIREAGITGMVGGALASPAVVLGGGDEEVVVPDAKAAAKKPITVADIPVPPIATPAPPVVSPVARVRAMPPDQQTARLAELTAIPTRTPDEEAEYQILLAVAPKVSPAVSAVEVPVDEPPPAPPEPLPAIPPPNPPTVPPVAAHAPPVAVGTPAEVAVPGIPAAPVPAAAVVSDYDRYQEIQQLWKAEIAKGNASPDNPVIAALWAENEEIKNRHGGMPPTAPEVSLPGAAAPPAVGLPGQEIESPSAPEAPAVPVIPAAPLPAALKPTRKWGRFGPRSDGVVDIIEAIQDTGGVPRPGPKRDGAFDGWEDVFGGRLKSLVGNRVGGWDGYMSENLIAKHPQFGHLVDAGASEIGDLISVALEQRSNLKRATAAQRVTNKFEERALGGVLKKAGKPIVSDTLNTATKFKVGGVPFEVSGVQEDGTVIVKDGPEYGQQVIPPGVDVFPDKNTLRRKKVAIEWLPADDADFVEAPVPPIAPPLPPLPTNVIPQDEIPWNLVPEPQKEPQSAVKLAEDNAAIKAEQDKQIGMFDQPPAFRTDSGFYSRVTRAVEQSPQAKASGAQWKATIRNSKIGQNQGEMDLMRVADLEDGRTYTKSEVTDYLKANEVVVKDVTLGAGEFVFNDNSPTQTALQARIQGDEMLVDAGGKLKRGLSIVQRDDGGWNLRDTKASVGAAPFESYQLPGATEGSYREVLLTVPERKTPAQPTEAEVMAQAKESAKANEEAPWDNLSEDTRRAYRMAARQRVIDAEDGANWRDGHSQYNQHANPIVRLRYNERTTADGKRMLFLEEVQPPQKGEFEKMPALFQKNWREIAFKWAIRKAADEGYDVVGWTTGEQQAARYSLEKQVRKIDWAPMTSGETGQPTGLKYVSLDTPNGLANFYVDKAGLVSTSAHPGIAPRDWSGKNVGDVIGKEIGARIVNEAKGVLSGEGLKVGGEGLKRLYDSDFRNAVNNLPVVKRAGQKVGTAEIATSKEISPTGEPYFEVAGTSITDPFSEIQYGERIPGDVVSYWVNLGVPEEVAKRAVADATVERNDLVHTLTITPAIREAAMQGQAIFRTSTEPTNPAVQAQRTNQFQITMGRLVSNGADVQAMSRELLIQQTGEVLERQIAELTARLAQATTAGQRRDLQQRIDVRKQLSSDTAQMRAVTFSPYHIAIAMDDVMNASLDNLVSLLHEAAESLTMRLGVEMQGAVFRAVESTTAEMVAAMQAAARNTGATIADVPNPGELLAETMAQKLADEGIPESTSLAQAIVRWVKAIYYRVSMAAQRAFGAEPNPEMALAWYENQLRRELGGDFEYAFSRLLDRFLPEQNTTRAAHYTGASGTPGGLVDFLDPITSKLRQPWVEPLSESAQDWNMRFRTADPNPGEGDGIPRDEAVDRIAAAAYNDEIRWMETLRAEIAPEMDAANFYGEFGRGEKNPVELLAALEAKREGVSEAEIGGDRMTDTMNGMANDQVLQFIRGIQIKNLKTVAKIRQAVASDEAAFTEHAQELNRLEPDIRNAELHEGELKKRAKTLIKGQLTIYKDGLKVAGTLGEMVANEESLGKNDPLPQFYQQVFDNLLKGDVPLFEYIEAIALLDIPLGTMTPTEIWKAIRDNADTSPKLRELSRNKPLALTISVMARDGARQVDQIQLRRADGQTFIEIRKELEGIRNATEAQLRVMLQTIDEKNAAKGLRQRIKLEYLKERRNLQRVSDRLAAAETRIDLLERAMPSVDEKVGDAEQAIGGIYSDWQPEGGAEFTVMRRQDDGTFQRAIRKLVANPDGSFADSEALLNDIAQNMQWLRANQERAGQKEYQRVQQQTYAIELLDVARIYQAANFGKIMGLADRFVRPIIAIARQAGHSSGARIVGQMNKYVFINRSGAKALTNAAWEWSYAFKGVMKSTGIEDYGRFRRQVFNPVMFFLGVNPGFDQSQAIRAAKAEARSHLATEPAADFDEKFERLLLATKKVNDEELKIAEQNNVLVSDPKLGGDLRHALPRGWLTGMRAMNDGVVVTLIHDMVDKGGWKLAFEVDKSGKRIISSAKGVTFSAVDAETAANPDALREAINPYFTPGILDRWLKPFINKPGEPVFKYDGQGISQLDLQAAWADSGGDVVAWIDALGERLGVNEEQSVEEVEADIGDEEGGAQDGADAAAKFRANMLRQIDHLFAWEARMAYEAEQTPELFAGQGTKMHVLMDARVNDLMPEEHVDFAMHDPQSVQQMLGQIAFHGAFGRNGQALVANLRELGGVTQAKKFAFQSLPSTTVEGKKRDAAAAGFSYDELITAAQHADDVAKLKGELEAAFGVKNTYGPLYDARAGMEILGLVVGQAVDQPKTGALNFLSIGARPFAMHSMSPRVLKATAMSYGALAKNTFGNFLRDFGIDLVRMSTFAQETGEVEGKAFRRLPWGVVLTGDMGKEGSFQDGLRQKFIVRPLRYIRAIQRKGFGPGLATLPGTGTMQRFATEGAMANITGQTFLLQEIINNGIKYFASHPDALSNPAFRFDVNSLDLRADGGMYDWFRNKTVEYNMGPIEGIVRGAIERQQAGERTITTRMVEQLAQMNAEEFDGASSINTAPAELVKNPLLQAAIPLLRWPLWFMHHAHNGLADAQGKADFKSMMRGIGRLAAWNLPLGLAFTFMIDEYDDKILGKKNAMPEVEKVGAIPVVGPALALATTDRGVPRELLGIGQRMIRTGNIYGLGADMVGSAITPFDPGSGQRLFSLDQRVLVMSQFLNFMQAARNMVSQGGTATWGSVYRPLVASIGGNGMLNSLGVVNNLLELDNAEARNNNRINAARWVNTAAKELGIETKSGSGFSSPTPMSVWTREMQLAAMANDRMGFMEAYRRAMEAAREKVAGDDRVPVTDREKEAAQRVLQSWRARNPFSGLATTPTPDQVQQMLGIMDDDGRADVQEAMRRFQDYTRFIAPSPIDQYINRRIRPPNPLNQIERMRRQAAGLMFAQ